LDTNLNMSTYYLSENRITTLWGMKKHTKMCFAITFVKLDGF